MNKDASPSQFTIHNSQFIILLLITLFAAFIRFYHLSILPPGLWFDEAWISVAARGNATPVYFAASFGGMHPAVVYLTRLAQTLTAALGMHHNPLAIRYALATIGTLTIPLAYFTTKQLLQATSYRLQVTDYPTSQNTPSYFILHTSYFPLLAAFILAILYPFLHFSRLGFESMLPAPAALLAFYLLAKLLRRQQSAISNQHIVHSSQFTIHNSQLIIPILLGLTLGLCLYTFDTGRFIPLAVALAYWWYVWVNRHHKPLSQSIIPFIIIVLIALIVAAPLLTFFWQNWPQFTERAAVTTYNTLGPGADSVPLAIGRNITRTLGGLSLPGWGDGIARHNLPGRPVFDIILSLFFWLGLFTLIRHPQRPLAIILLSWLIFTLLPVILTDGAPTYTRIFGAIPALAITAALGLTTTLPKIITVIAKAASAKKIHNSQFTIHNSSYFILHTSYFIFLLLSTTSTLTDYFIRWPQTPALFDDFQVGQWQAGQLALAESATATTYFVPNLIDEAHPTLDLLLRNSAVRPHPAAPCLIYQPNPTQPVSYLIDTLADKQMSDTLQQLYPGLETAVRIRHQPSGDTIYRLFQITPQAKIQNPPTKIQTSATFADTIQLTAYERPPSFTIHNSPTLPITLHWHPLTPPPADYTIFLHLYPTGREDEAPLAQLDTQPCWPTSRWHTDETIRDQQTFALPANLPPGDYTLALGLYTFPTFERLPLNASAAQTLPDQRYILMQFTIPTQ